MDDFSYLSNILGCRIDGSNVWNLRESDVPSDLGLTDKLKCRYAPRITKRSLES